jgi:peptide-methionine (R)-S-oxide reductase
VSDKVVKSEAEWRAQLVPEQYAVCRERGTERAFAGMYWDCKETGIYRCACCGNQLFDSEAKYDSGTGWPSFTTPIGADRIREHSDSSHGMQRVEVMCARCDAHLGHVFEDGPPPSGQRFCINSCALDLERQAG